MGVTKSFFSLWLSGFGLASLTGNQRERKYQVEAKMSKNNSTYTKFPNFIIDKIMPLCTYPEWKILTLIARKTYGFHKEKDRISYSQFQEFSGISSRATVSKALKGLLEKNIISRDNNGYWYICCTSTGNELVQEMNQGSTPNELPSTPSVPELVQEMNTQKKIKENNTKETSKENILSNKLINTPEEDLEDILEDVGIDSSSGEPVDKVLEDWFPDEIWDTEDSSPGDTMDNSVNADYPKEEETQEEITKWWEEQQELQQEADDWAEEQGYQSSDEGWKPQVGEHDMSGLQKWAEDVKW